MKRLIGLFILSLFLFSFVFAEEPDSQTSLEDPQKLTEKVPEGEKELAEFNEKLDSLPIDKETGKFNLSKIEGIKLNATKRIDAINDYVNETANWTKPIFRMVPEISWLFFANLYVFLFFFTILVLNGDEFFFYISENWMAYLSGLGLFGIGLVTSLYINLARFLVNFVDMALDILVPIGLIAFVLGIVLLVVLVILFPMFIRFVVKIPFMLLKGTGLRQIVKEGKGELKKLKEEREVIGGFTEGLEG
jgi:hypothetical protein